MTLADSSERGATFRDTSKCMHYSNQADKFLNEHEPRSQSNDVTNRCHQSMVIRERRHCLSGKRQRIR